MLMILAMIVLNLLSLFMLTVITIERYIGVLHPYSYQNSLTKRRVLTYVAVASLVSFTRALTVISTYTLEAPGNYGPI